MRTNPFQLTAFLLVVMFGLQVGISPLYAEDTPSLEDLENLSEEELMGAFDPGSLPQGLGASSAVAQASRPPEVSSSGPQRITLELKGVDVLDVLKILSSRSQLNIVAGKNVRGQVTIYLKDVLIRDALSTIIATLDLAYAEEKGIIQVMTSKDYEAKYGRPFGDSRITRTFKLTHADPAAINEVIQQVKSPGGKIVLDERSNTLIVFDFPEVVSQIEDAVRELDQPLVTKVFKMKFAEVSDLETLLTDYMTPESGILKVDKRTNQISITDRKEVVDRIELIVSSFDVRPPQVLIEAQIVEVTLSDKFRYGIDWEFVRERIGGYAEGLNLQPDSLGISAPSGRSLSTVTLGQTGVSGLDNLVVSILQDIGKTNTLSSPRVTVLNNEEAKLVDATQQPYVTQTVSQTTTTSQTADQVEFVDVGVTLTVVPTIADENTIVLKLKPEVSVAASTPFTFNTASASVTEAFERTIPIVSTQTLETTVIVKSGETLVVGGLIKDSESLTLRKVPMLGDIPVLGALFNSKSSDFTKTELVIFLTPYIVSGDVTTKEHEKYIDQEGQLIDFDQVGGTDVAIGYRHSQGPLRRDHKPFWKIEEDKFPRYDSPDDLYERSEPYRGQINEFYSETEGRQVLPKQVLLEAYEKSLGEEISAALVRVEELSGANWWIDLALHVQRDGFLKDVSVIDKGSVKDRRLQRKILQVIRSSGPYSPFPKDLDSNAELFELRFTFSPEEQNEEPVNEA